MTQPSSKASTPLHEGHFSLYWELLRGPLPDGHALRRGLLEVVGVDAPEEQCLEPVPLLGVDVAQESGRQSICEGHDAPVLGGDGEARADARELLDGQLQAAVGAQPEDRMRQIASRSELATSPPLPSCANTSRSRPRTGSTETLTCMLPNGVICRIRRQLMISGSLTGESAAPSSVSRTSSPATLSSPVSFLSRFSSAMGCRSRQPSRYTVTPLTFRSIASS